MTSAFEAMKKKMAAMRAFKSAIGPGEGGGGEGSDNATPVPSLATANVGTSTSSALSPKARLGGGSKSPRVSLQSPQKSAGDKSPREVSIKEPPNVKGSHTTALDIPSKPMPRKSSGSAAQVKTGSAIETSKSASNSSSSSPSNSKIAPATVSLDKYDAMRLKLNEMRDAKRTPGESGSRTETGSRTDSKPGSKTARIERNSDMTMTSPDTDPPRRIAFAATPSSVSPSPSARASFVEEGPSEEEMDKLCQEYDDNMTKKGRKMKKQGSLSKYDAMRIQVARMREKKKGDPEPSTPQPLKAATSAIPMFSEKDESKVRFAGGSDIKSGNNTPSKNPPAHLIRAQSTGQSPGPSGADKMNQAASKLLEMKERTASRRKRKEELRQKRAEEKANRKNALNGQIGAFMKIVQNLEPMLKKLEQDKLQREKDMRELDTELGRMEQTMLINAQLLTALTNTAVVQLEGVVESSKGQALIQQVRSNLVAITSAMQGGPSLNALIPAKEVSVDALATVSRKGSTKDLVTESRGGGPPPPPTGAAPPPPPPPPPVILAVPALSTTSGLKCSARLKVQGSRIASRSRIALPSSGSSGGIDLLAQIRTGKNLKKVDHDQVAAEKAARGPTSIMDSLKDTLALAMDIRKKAMEDEEEDDWSDEEDDWSDDDGS